MITFLDQVKAEILRHHPDDLSGVCVVFPTRRAALIFRHKLAEGLARPVFAPAIFSIRDFISRVSEMEVADDLKLVFELFQVHKKYFPEESFDRFFHWGEMLLNDFSEMDMEMVNASHLFTNIVDLKKIEAEFGLDEEEAERISNFWKNFSKKEITPIRRNFLDTWTSLPRIYSDFRKALAEKNLAYEGMAWQKALEVIRSGNEETKWSKIYFAGFYGLSRAHETILAELQKQQRAEIFFDADNYYTDDAVQEAGSYFRNKKFKSNNIKWKGDYFKSPKSITVAGIPLLAGQAKYCGSIIQKLIRERKFDESKTVIVVPDENLLVPLLYSLPPEIESFNITMGYPVHKSMAAQLTDALFDLDKNKRETAGGIVKYYSKDIQNLLSHPYVTARFNPDAAKLNEAISKVKLFRLSTDELTKISGSGLEILLTEINESKHIILKIKKILEAFLTAEGEQKLSVFDEAIVRYMYEELDEAGKSILESVDEISAETCWKIIRRIIRFLKVPFSGEPVKGLQVMGMLETRALDFENVFILSVNESIVPPSSSGSSYIPYNLRKGFGMPGYEERDAAYAYHFYRLMQRAKNIFLIHDTEVKSISGGERSRYIYQLEYELKKYAGENLNLDFKIISSPFSGTVPRKIEIKKSREILDYLHKNYSTESEGAKGFSASALSAYIHCSLQFYFRHIAGLKEPDAREEIIEADVFGKILHKAMEVLYSGQKMLTAEKINLMFQQSDAAAENAFHSEFYYAKNELEGKNYLDMQIIRKLIRQILESDALIAPFEIAELEKEYTAASGRYRLKGIFDRVHIKDGIHHIVDYKTGKADIKSKTDLDKIFSSPDLKTTFQLLLYSYVFSKNFPEKKIKAGVFRMKSAGSGIDYLEKGELISDELLGLFEEKLQILLNEIFNPEIPFVQTQELKRCVHCPYKEICTR